MQNMRDLLKQNLGRSLQTLPPLDRLSTAWPVACGKTMAAQATIMTYENQVLTLAVADPLWQDQFFTMRHTLARDLARIAEVPIREIHFEQRKHSR